MDKAKETELKVGFFITVGVALLMLAVLLLGGGSQFFSSQDKYTVHFDAVDGLVSGAKVMLGGILVGQVAEIDFDSQTKDVKVTLAVNSEHSEWIRKDTGAEIQTQGVLGDKYIKLNMGSLELPALPPGSEIEMRPGQGISTFLSKGDQLLVSLNSVANGLDKMLKTFEKKGRQEVFFDGLSQSAKNLAGVTASLDRELKDIKLNAAVKNLNDILRKINRGKGSVGALINDPALYDDLKSLLGGANRSRIMRNLVRQTIKDREDEAAPPAQN